MATTQSRAEAASPARRRRPTTVHRIGVGVAGAAIAGVTPLAAALDTTTAWSAVVPGDGRTTINADCAPEATCAAAGHGRVSHYTIRTNTKVRVLCVDGGNYRFDVVSNPDMGGPLYGRYLIGPWVAPTVAFTDLRSEDGTRAVPTSEVETC